jgi:hypothetical protein
MAKMAASPTTQDLWRMWLQANLPFNNATGISTDVTAGAQIPNAIATKSTVVSGAVTAPTVGQTIAATAGISGIIKCDVYLTFTGSGTPVLTDCTNVTVDFGGDPIFKPFIDITPGKVTGPFTFYGVGFNPVTVKAIAAGTANVTYNASIIATKVA